MWQFDITTRVWTLLNPSNVVVNNAGSYGTKLQAGATFLPPSRSNAGATYDQASRTMYLFGGINGSKRYTDLWRFNFDTKLWTFVSGLTVNDKVGVYPTVAYVSGPTFYPGSRSGASLTLTTNYLYLFGGSGLGKTTSTMSQMNDFWRYDLRTNEWAWLEGNPTALGTFGDSGTRKS